MGREEDIHELDSKDACHQYSPSVYVCDTPFRDGVYPYTHLNLDWP